MKENQKQKIERLERLVSELKAEGIQLRKERKRLNYAVNSNRNQTSAENEKKIKKLDAEILTLHNTINKVRMESDAQTDILQIKIFKKDEYIKLLEERLQQYRREANARDIEYAHNKVVEAVMEFYNANFQYRGNRIEDKERLREFMNGAMTDNKRDSWDGCGKEAFFDSYNLQILIHPGTGRILANSENIPIYEAIKDLKYPQDYRKEYEEKTKDLDIFSDERKRLAYEYGMKILPYYARRVFQADVSKHVFFKTHPFPPYQ